MADLVPLASTRSAPFRAALPGSKSATQRALLIAARRIGATRVEGASACEDCELLAAALDAFGGLAVAREGEAFVVERSGAALRAPAEELFLGAAGAAARLLAAFAVSAEGATRLTGVPRLRERPMADGVAALRSLGARVECPGVAGHLPLRVHGTAIAERTWRVRADVSSQFTSALCLLAAAQPRGPIRILLEGEPVSAPYVELTLAMLRAAGIDARRDAPDAITVEPGEPRVATLRVEPDASSLSYFLAAAALTGTTVEAQGLGSASLQGDVGFARLLERMGCTLEAAPQRLRLGGPRTLRGIEADLGAMPDVALTLAALAAVAEGPSRLEGLATLRHKECDRIDAAARALERLGATVEEGPAHLVVRPRGPLRPARIETRGDHRMAMAFAVPSLVAPGISVDDEACVAKSFPGFWGELARFRRHHEGGGDG